MTTPNPLGFSERVVRYIKNPWHLTAGRWAKAVQAPNGRLYRLPLSVLRNPLIALEWWQKIEAGLADDYALVCIDPDPNDLNARWILQSAWNAAHRTRDR